MTAAILGFAIYTSQLTAPVYLAGILSQFFTAAEWLYTSKTLHPQNWNT